MRSVCLCCLYIYMPTCVACTKLHQYKVASSATSVLNKIKIQLHNLDYVYASWMNTCGLYKLCTPVVTRGQIKNTRFCSANRFALHVLFIRQKPKTQVGFSCCHNLSEEISKYLKRCPWSPKNLPTVFWAWLKL